MNQPVSTSLDASWMREDTFHISVLVKVHFQNQAPTYFFMDYIPYVIIAPTYLTHLSIQQSCHNPDKLWQSPVISIPV